MRRFVLLMVMAAALASCENGRTPPELGSYPSIISADAVLLEAGEYPTVTVVIDPSQCLSCATSIGAWRDIWARTPDRVRFVLSEDPDSATLIILKRSRLPVSGVLSRRLRSMFTPQSAYIVRARGSTPETYALDRATPEFAGSIISASALEGS